MRRHTETAAQTEALGSALAAAREPATDGLIVLYLEGELGSGKTTFARGFLRACGVTGTVRSPTYTLVEPYACAALTVVHADLYRLRSAAELEPLGLRDWARAGYLWLVEWPERAAGALPTPDLTLRFEVGSSGHDIELAAASAVGGRWLARLEDMLAHPEGDRQGQS